MRIYIYSGNHDNSHGIGDTMLFLQRAFRDCGMNACLTHEYVPGAWHVLMEHFVEERHLDDLIKARHAGARFILIGTEPIIDGGFNKGIDATHWHYSKASYWKTRFDNFTVAAALSDAVWVLAESMVASYRQALGREVRFLPHGHVTGFATVRPRDEAELDIDFFFSGSITAYRQQILTALGRSHNVVCCTQNTPEYLRLDLLSRSKVCLSLKLSPANDIPSVSRMHFHLQNKSFLLHERYALPCVLDPYVLQVPSEELLDWAEEALNSPQRRDMAEAAHARFEADLPMRALLPPLLDRAMGRLAMRLALQPQA